MSDELLSRRLAAPAPLAKADLEGLNGEADAAGAKPLSFAQVGQVAQATLAGLQVGGDVFGNTKTGLVIGADRKPMVNPIDDPYRHGGLEQDVLPVTAATHPFQIIADTGASVRVVYGTVSNVVPTDMNVGDDPVFTIGSLVTGPIYLIIPHTDWGDIGEVTIDNGASIPTDDFDWSTGEGTTHVEIGSVVVDGGEVTAIAQNLLGSINFLMEGDAPGWTAV